MAWWPTPRWHSQGSSSAEASRSGTSPGAVKRSVGGAAAPPRGRSRGGHFPYYAVRVGRRPGIYHTNDEAQEQVSGVPGNEYRGFHRYSDAARYLAGGRAVDGPSARSRSRSRSRSRARSSGEREAISRYYGRF